MSAAPLSDDTLARVRELAKELLTHMGFEAEVAAAADEEGHVALDIQCEDTETLLGEEGRTIEALQVLLNRMMRRVVGPDTHCRVDIAGHLARRRAALASEAKDLADRVRATGRPFTFPPLTAAERRAIHRALADDPDLETVSFEDPHERGEKRLVIRLREPFAPAADAPAGE
jgi:spoIIIJ-associated protein